MTIYFISGHGDITDKEFEDHYVPEILKVLKDMHSSFVVGDFRGADTRAQSYLKFSGTRRPGQGVTVYHMFKEPRNNLGFAPVGGFQSDEERDSAMTRNSDKDIAWVRPGKEKSCTAKNLKRRDGLQEGSVYWGLRRAYSKLAAESLKEAARIRRLGGSKEDVGGLLAITALAHTEEDKLIYQEYYEATRPKDFVRVHWNSREQE